MRIPLRTTEEAAKPQPCGDCNACCHYPAIIEFNKPLYTPCIKLDKVGKRIACGIYADRPAECSEYWCYFIGGFFGKDISYRPDKLGLAIDFRGFEGSGMEEGFGFAQVWETRPNAHKEKRANAVIESLRPRFAVILRKYGERANKFTYIQKFGGSKELFEKVLAFLQGKFHGENHKIEIDSIK